MCRGRVEEESQDFSKALREETAALLAHANQGSVSCELCDSEATIYCPADDALLCRECDKQVHGANFLAKRHIRCLICRTCQSLTNRYLIGVSVEVLLPTIIAKSEKRPWSSNLEENQTKDLKRPFLLL
ncbi:Zinc finger protein CONSTANS-LIKE 14 [Heracleum sosnowskyi]|uniref:Zinc finger protein CONSTANS-LIKE 14 n=1 Tax=Heracleum sosnowskyi TaxID=360622 RepID=A0AAD8J3K2_9APIA|nr:Zinc finger protein CONSTANS-LIKE 14 [Heracleum sosnowskyi]